MVKNKIILVMLLLFAGICFGSDKKAYAAGFMAEIPHDKVTKDYDVTNDGKKDKIYFKKIAEDEETYKSLKVYVNDRLALTIAPKYGFLQEMTKINIMRLSNGKTYLFVHLGENNDDGPCDIYEYRKKKFRKVVNLIKRIDNILGYHSGAEISRVKGNRIYVNMESMSFGLAAVRLQSIYKCKKGKLVLESKTHKIIGYYKAEHMTKAKYTLTTSKALQLYRGGTLKVKKKKIKKGTKLKVTKCYISGKRVSFYVKTKSGEKGWFKSPKDEAQLFKEITYAG